MKDICVVYLAYKDAPVEAYEVFIESYKRYYAGVDHNLLVVYKGFTVDEALDLKRADNLDFDWTILSLEGFDINAYYAVVHGMKDRYKYFCFLNSYSRIRCNDWLRKMYNWTSKEDFGMVGATGSWESADNLPPFPNYHLRTNAFMIKGEDFLACETPIQNKFDCNMFEAGWSSLTRKILAMGKTVRVVGADGTGYEKEAWGGYGGYRTGDQQNLLIADNRTDHYQFGDAATRQYLKTLAWGDKSNDTAA